MISDDPHHTAILRWKEINLNAKCIIADFSFRRVWRGFKMEVDIWTGCRKDLCSSPETNNPKHYCQYWCIHYGKAQYVPLPTIRRRYAQSKYSQQESFSCNRPFVWILRIGNLEMHFTHKNRRFRRTDFIDAFRGTISSQFSCKHSYCYLFYFHHQWIWSLNFCLFCSSDVFLLKLHSFFVKLNKIFCTCLQSTQLVPVRRLEILEALHHVGVSGAVGEAVARVPALDGGQALVQRRGRGLELDVLRAQPAMAGDRWFGILGERRVIVWINIHLDSFPLSPL